MNAHWLLPGVVICVVGCGGESQDSNSSGASGAGGTNGVGAASGVGGAGTASAGSGQGAAGRGAMPPAAQGAFWAQVRSVSPQPPGKLCPVSAALTFDVPSVDPSGTPSESLDADTYLHNVIDGEGDAAVSCSVRGSSSYLVQGAIRQGAKSLTISDGSLDADKQGVAKISLRDSGNPGFSGSLSAPSANCSLDAAAAAGHDYQVKPGSIWAHFSCPSVEQVPSDYCTAEGYFVLENCEQ